MSELNPIKEGIVATHVTMTADEAEEVWRNINEETDKSEELADAVDDARCSANRDKASRYILIEITP